MKLRLIPVLLFVSFCVAFAVTAHALTGGVNTEPPPRIFPYQGYLEDMDGPVSGDRTVKFLITESTTEDCEPESGACRWTTEIPVTFHNGYFYTELTGFPTGLFDENELYIRVGVYSEGWPEDESEMVLLDGGQRLLATPYTITAQMAVPLLLKKGGADVGAGASGGALRIEESGNVLAIDGNEIQTNNTLHINLDTRQLTTLYGTVEVKGKLFTRTQDFGFTAGNLIGTEMYANDGRSICFLSVTSTTNNAGCRIDSSTNWILAGTPTSNCNAICVGL